MHTISSPFDQSPARSRQRRAAARRGKPNARPQPANWALLACAINDLPGWQGLLKAATASV